MNRARVDCSRLPRRQAIPLSVKTRLGYDEDVIEEWVDCLRRGNPEVISIHGRTLAQMYRGNADWSAIGKAAERLRGHGCLVLGNGDCASMSDVVDRVRATGVHGVLLGRATLGHPWVFRTKESVRLAFSQDAPHPVPEPQVDLDERFQIMLGHAKLFESLYGTAGFPRMRKHLGWYCHGFPYAASLRAKMFRTTSSRDAEQLVAHTVVHAKEAIQRLRLMDAGYGSLSDAPVESGTCLR